METPQLHQQPDTKQQQQQQQHPVHRDQSAYFLAPIPTSPSSLSPLSATVPATSYYTSAFILAYTIVYYANDVGSSLRYTLPDLFEADTPIPPSSNDSGDDGVFGTIDDSRVLSFALCVSIGAVIVLVVLLLFSCYRRHKKARRDLLQFNHHQRRLQQLALREQQHALYQQQQAFLTPQPLFAPAMTTVSPFLATTTPAPVAAAYYPASTYEAPAAATATTAALYPTATYDASLYPTATYDASLYPAATYAAPYASPTAATGASVSTPSSTSTPSSVFCDDLSAHLLTTEVSAGAAVALVSEGGAGSINDEDEDDADHHLVSSFSLKKTTKHVDGRNYQLMN